MVSMNLPIPGVTKGFNEAPSGQDWATLNNNALIALNGAKVETVKVVTGSEPRPATAASVMWIGGAVQPAGMLNGDLWFQSGGAAPTAPTVLTSALSPLAVGVAYAQTLAASGSVPLTWSVTSGVLPSGVTLSPSGVLTGTPTTAGTYSFTVTVTNVAGSNSKAFSGTVAATAATPAITTATLTSLTVGTVYSQTLSATGTTPITFAVTAGTLPAGVTMTSGGILSGTPTTAGSYSVTITATNAAGSSSKAFNGIVFAMATAPTITTTSINALQATVTFSQTITATGTTPMTWGITVGSLPSGLSLNSSTGTISGTPTAAGAYSFTVTATNSAGSNAKAYSGTVAAAPVLTPKSIFGTTAPFTAPTAYSDGGPSIETAARFYGTKNISIVGARVWRPVSSPAPFLAMGGTIRAWAGDYSGATLRELPASAPDRTKTFGPGTAGQWTECLFDTPIPLTAISPSTGTQDFVTISVKFTDPAYYVSATTNSGDMNAVPSVEDSQVYLAEGPFGRGAYTNNIGAYQSNAYYGLDILFTAS